MSIRTIRKALGLLIIDFVIIIGIFVLQFRTDSNIIEKIGNLQITFAKTDSDASRNDNEFALKNKLKISYNGINFFFDEQNPAKVIMEGQTEPEEIQLVSYNKLNDLAYEFVFNNDARFTVELSDNSSNASLITYVSLPKDVQELYFPYSFSYGMKISKEEGNKVVFEGKKTLWQMSVPAFRDDVVVFDNANRFASYGIYDETKAFSLESLVDSALADSSILDVNVKNLKNQLISVFKTNTSDANISEQTLVSYIAVMAERGSYTDAIDEISKGLKKTIQRTYLSAPYLDSLSAMNAVLEQSVKDKENQITKASYSGSLDLFAVRNLAPYLCIHQNASAVEKVLKAAAETTYDQLPLTIAVGIMETYIDLCSYNKQYANILEPVLNDCIQRITDACKFDGTAVTISDNDTFLSVIQAVETGVAVMRYGIISEDANLQKAGNVIINSYINDVSSFDLRTLSNLYPLFAFDNWYYPHFQKITTPNNQMLWAWTCARNITCSKDGDNALTLTIDFPEGYSHYMIVKGIPSFKRIYIYNTLFRTDPRFETYNSSGYIYKADTNTLLLKSRHKSRMEDIRMEYNSKEPQKPVPAPKATPKVEEVSVSESATGENAGAVTTESAVIPATTGNQPVLGTENNQ